MGGRTIAIPDSRVVIANARLALGLLCTSEPSAMARATLAGLLVAVPRSPCARRVMARATQA